jgi:hypothetical protein
VIVAATAQRDVVGRGLATERVGPLVVELEERALARPPPRMRLDDGRMPLGGDRRYREDGM